jgi:hypothetical protein
MREKFWIGFRNSEKRKIPWSEFTQEVTDITGSESYQDIDEDNFSLDLIGVTISMEDGEEMYPVRDLEQGITRGYSTD